MKKSIWFVINPISGVRRKDDLPELIHEHIDHTQFDYKINDETGRDFFNIALLYNFDLKQKGNQFS